LAAHETGDFEGAAVGGDAPAGRRRVVCAALAVVAHGRVVDGLRPALVYAQLAQRLDLLEDCVRSS